MTTTLRNIGNSKGVVVPAHLLKELDIQVGDTMEPAVENGKLVLTPTAKRQKYKLADLLAAMTEDNAHDAVDFGGPVGQEAL